MDMQTLNRMKTEAVAALLALVKPHMSISQRLKDSKGEPLMFWAPDTPNSATIKLDKSLLPPVYAVCKEGVLCNGYGNAWVRSWEEVGVEDVVKLTVVAQEALVPQPELQAIPQALRQCEAWSVEALEPLNHKRTMYNVRGKQRSAQGDEREFSFAVEFGTQGNPLLDRLSQGVRSWMPGAVSQFTSDLENAGAEVLLAQTT